jgi:hypothetical protein
MCHEYLVRNAFTPLVTRADRSPGVCIIRQGGNIRPLPRATNTSDHERANPLTGTTPAALSTSTGGPKDHANTN